MNRLIWSQYMMNRVIYQRFGSLNVPAHRNFRTSPQSRLPIAPVIWAVLKPIIKVGAIFSGRQFRKWWQALQPEKRQQFVTRVFSFRYQIVGVAGVMTGAGGLYYRSHLQETPVTGRRRFIAFNDKQIASIAKAEAQATTGLYASQLIPDGHPYRQQVKRVVERLISSNQDLQNLPNVSEWTIWVIESKDRNAFVMPTGEIFVFTGLLSVAENDDQLSIVLGHELSHVLLSHAAEKISHAQILDWLIIVAMAAVWAVMPTDGIALITQWFYNKVIELAFHMPYSRKLEKEADHVGLELCAKACYDVREGSVFWTKMSCLSHVNGEDAVPEMLSTHPVSDKRAIHLDFITPKAMELRTACHCPPLPMLDPRRHIESYKKLAHNVLVTSKASQNLQQVSTSTEAKQQS